MEKEFHEAAGDINQSIQRLHDELIKLQDVIGCEKEKMKKYEDDEKIAVAWGLGSVRSFSLMYDHRFHLLCHVLSADCSIQALS